MAKLLTSRLTEFQDRIHIVTHGKRIFYADTRICGLPHAKAGGGGVKGWVISGTKILLRARSFITGRDAEENFY